MANVSSFSGAMPVIPGGTVELGYGERTTPVSFTTSAQTVVAPVSVVHDGSPVLVELFSPYQWGPSSSNTRHWVYLSDGSYRQFALSGLTTYYGGFYGSWRYTPPAGTETYEWKTFADVAGGSLGSGTGAASQYVPSFLRVSKIVQQNDGLKPFWTPPIVTQLPSNATVGDQVTFYTSSGAYQPYQYMGTNGWKQMGTSKPPSCRVRKTATQTYLNPTTVSWDTDSGSGAHDTDGMWDAGSPTVITIQTTGLYLVTASIGASSATANAITTLQMSLQTSAGGNFASFGNEGNTGTGANASASGVTSLTAGDTVSVLCYFNGSGTGLTIGTNSTMSATWLGQVS